MPIIDKSRLYVNMFVMVWGVKGCSMGKQRFDDLRNEIVVTLLT